MPLSEEEQRILRQIEEQFHQEDPKFVREVSRSRGRAQPARRFKLAIGGVVLGFLLMVLFLAISESVFLSMIGFGLALVSGVAAYYAFRHMAGQGLNDLRRRRSNASQRVSVNRLRRRPRNDD